MKKLKTWQIILLIIFYPVGITYFIWWLIKKQNNSTININNAQSYSNNYDINELLSKSRQRDQNRQKYNAVFREHDTLREKIGILYSVLSNQKIYDSPEMDKCIELCWEDIELAPIIKEAELAMFDLQSPVYPTFSRLAIIYEKRKEYEKAAEVCVIAINLNYTNDGTEGGMHGRLSRLINKSGTYIDVNEYLKQQNLL